MIETIQNIQNTQNIQNIQNTQNTQKIHDIVFAFASDQGRRPYMEDYAAHITSSSQDLEMFAVFDGHGGSKVAELCAQKVGRIVVDEYPLHLNFDKFMMSVFEKLDQGVPGDAEIMHQGCTATVVVIDKVGGRILCGNAGDSEGMYICGEHQIMLTKNHKVENEMERLHSMGAFVTHLPGDSARINGALNLARSIGDKYLFPFVAWQPFVSCVDATLDKKQFIFIASDGIWDVFTMDQVNTHFEEMFPLKQRQNMDITKHDLHVFLKKIIKVARDRGSSDNIAIFGIAL